MAGIRKLFLSLAVSSLLITGAASPVMATTINVGGLRLHKKVSTMLEVKHQNISRQSRDYTCGAAALSTLLNYYLDDPVSEEEIIHELHKHVPREKAIERGGFTLLDLKNFAQAKGYNVTGYRMDTAFLRQVKQPVLVRINLRNYSHFVIVKGVLADRIFMADPTAGNLSMKIPQFEKIWTNGIGLIVEDPTEDRIAEGKTYALKVDDDDIIISDYKRLRQLIDNGAIRTAIYPSEWK